MSLQTMVERSTEMFRKCFGRKPRWIVAAPGRVNLLGEHTDYNDGFVLPMAIERYTLIAADRNSAKQVTIHSETTCDTATFSVRADVTTGEPSWSNYVRGVVAGFQNLDKKVSGFHAVAESSLPYGGGLASSAALEVATATILELMRGKNLPPRKKAELCQAAEHRFAGVPCGIMDQFTSILGRQDEALLLDCRSGETTYVPLNDPKVTVLIVNTQVRHKLAESEYARRRAQCQQAARALGVNSLRDATLKQLQATRSRMEPVVFRRARHVLNENERTLEAAEAMKQSAWKDFGRLMYASHESLREDFEVSSPELDTIVQIAKEIGLGGGMLGCRMTGGGFGGCAVCLVATEALQSVTRRMVEAYELRTRTSPMLFSSRPVGGVRVLKGG